MTIAILQALLAAAGCYGLWRLWRALAGRGRASQVITAGFVLRALGSQLLFWISWLRLPIARSLQLGDGLWFFAIDGQWYLTYARDLLRRGPLAIVFVSGSYASRIFTQWLTVFTAAFGVVASTGILFNSFFYLATCGLILLIARDDERPRDFALAAIAFGPATILWSLQPLKDTYFVFLIVAMVAIWREWQKLWRGEGVRRPLPIAICAATMWYLVYAISGTRWYVGAFLVAISFFFLGVVANRPRPRLAGSVVAVLLFVVLGQAFVAGGDFDIPLPLRTALDVRTIFRPRAHAERAKVLLTTVRRGFEMTPGNTMIVPGRALQTVAPVPTEPQPKPKAEPAPPSAEKVEASPPPPPPAKKPESAAALSPPAKNPEVAPPPPRPFRIRRAHHRRVRAAAPSETVMSLVSKIAAGAAAMFVPRAIAQTVGLVRIGGGRGFWLFADLDTVVFDLVIFVALAYCARAIVRRERRVTPLFLLVLLLFAGLTAPMVYVVANFGTLFRLREMLYVFAALLPLTLGPRTPAPAPDGSR